MAVIDRAKLKTYLSKTHRKGKRPKKVEARVPSKRHVRRTGRLLDEIAQPRRLNTIKTIYTDDEKVELTYVLENSSYYDVLNAMGRSQFTAQQLDRLRFTSTVWQLLDEIKDGRGGVAEQKQHIDLTVPWNEDNYEQLKALFSRILKVEDVANSQLWLVDWEQYFRELLKAFSKANDNVEEVIADYNDRQIRNRQRKVALASFIFSVALSSFGAAPVSGIVSGLIAKGFDVQGPSAFGEQTTWTLGSGSSVNVSRDVGFGTADRGHDSTFLNILDNWAREGAANASNAVVNKIGEKCIAKVGDKIKDKLQVSKLSGTEDFYEDLQRMLEHGFDDLKRDIWTNLGDIERFYSSSVTVDDVVRIIAYSQSKPLDVQYGARLIDTVRAYVEATRTELVGDLSLAFACPVNEPGVPFSTHRIRKLEKVIWSAWLLENKTILEKKKSVPKEIAEYFIEELQVATRRDTRLGWLTGKTGRKNVHEMERKRFTERGHKITLGKRAKGHSLEMMMLWAKQQAKSSDWDAILGIDKKQRKKINAFHQTLACSAHITNIEKRFADNGQGGLRVRSV